MPRTDARERILAAARRRYYAEGIRAVSADRLLAEAGVSKVTFYRHFPTKDALVVAYLESLAAEERAAFDEARERLGGDGAAIWEWYTDLLGEVSCAPGFRGCPFINAAAELADPDHRGRAVIAARRTWLVDRLAGLLRDRVVDAERRAEQLMMLRDGAMVAGYAGRDAVDVGADLAAAAAAIVGRGHPVGPRLSRPER